jgi:hypothetical protein
MAGEKNLELDHVGILFFFFTTPRRHHVNFFYIKILAWKRMTGEKNFELDRVGIFFFNDPSGVTMSNFF